MLNSHLEAHSGDKLDLKSSFCSSCQVSACPERVTFPDSGPKQKVKKRGDIFERPESPMM